MTQPCRRRNQAAKPIVQNQLLKLSSGSWFKEAYKVYYAKNEQSGKSDPVIDHSGFVFLVGRDGKYLGFFPPGTSADRLIDGLRPHLAVTQRSSPVRP